MLFLGIWLPIVMLIFLLMASRDKLGPGEWAWLRKFQEWTFRHMWKMHDGLFAPVFGRGDITS